MKSLKWPGLIVGLVLLLYGTMAPVWTVAIAAAMVLVRPPKN